jgi:hypothetical protein
MNPFNPVSRGRLLMMRIFCRPTHEESLQRRVRRNHQKKLRRVQKLRSRLQPLGFTALRSAGRANVLKAIELVRPVSTEHDLIRLGGPHDGGYLVPDDLAGIQACFSPGVSEIANFELDLAQRGIPSFMADASVTASPVAHELLHFEPLWLGAMDDSDGDTLSLDSWVAMHAPDSGDLLLQMDIEDAEWATLAAASDDTLARFRIMVIEFHDLESLSSRKGLEYMGSVFQRLNRLFLVVHAHPNNARKIVRLSGVKIHPVMEFTLLRRDRITQPGLAGSFPHPLDSPNVLKKRDIALLPEWYRDSAQKRR